MKLVHLKQTKYNMKTLSSCSKTLFYIFSLYTHSCFIFLNDKFIGERLQLQDWRLLSATATSLASSEERRGGQKIK